MGKYLQADRDEYNICHIALLSVSSAYCRKICTTKALLKLHLEATQHHSYDVVGEDESEAENVDEVEDATVIPDGPCLTPCMKVFLMGTFETTYDRKDLL